MQPDLVSQLDKLAEVMATQERLIVQLQADNARLRERLQATLDGERPAYQLDYIYRPSTTVG